MRAQVKNIMKASAYILAAFVAASALASCRKELCYNHWEHAPSAKAYFNASYEREWERDYGKSWEENWDGNLEFGYDSLRPAVPNGLRVISYSADGEKSEYNTGPYGDLVPLFEGGQYILFYNNDTEYLVFNDIDEYTMATASTRTRTRGTYSQSHEDEITVNAPDMLYAHCIEDWNAERKVEADSLDILMQPLVYTYYIRYDFTYGLKYVSIARGALSGMAAAVYLNNGTTAEDKVTILYDCIKHDSHIDAKVMSFGIPNFPDNNYNPTKAEDETYKLNLEVRLTNGEILDFEQDVTDQVHAQPRGGIIRMGGLSIADTTGLKGSSGFDVDVDGWGDQEDIILPL